MRIKFVWDLCTSLDVVIWHRKINITYYVWLYICMCPFISYIYSPPPTGKNGWEKESLGMYTTLWALISWLPYSTLVSVPSLHPHISILPPRPVVTWMSVGSDVRDDYCNLLKRWEVLNCVTNLPYGQRRERKVVGRDKSQWRGPLNVCQNVKCMFNTSLTPPCQRHSFQWRTCINFTTFRFRMKTFV